jgi:hypothetical protein
VVPDAVVLVAVWALVGAHTGLDPHEVMHHPLAPAALPLHGIGLGLVRHTTAAALARGTVLGPVLLHARAPVVLELDVLGLPPRVLALLALLKHHATKTLGMQETNVKVKG